MRIFSTWYLISGSSPGGAFYGFNAQMFGMFYHDDQAGTKFKGKYIPFKLTEFYAFHLEDYMKKLSDKYKEINK